MGLRESNLNVSAWANWAEAFFMYCDGGSLTGTRMTPDTNHTANGEDCPGASCTGQCSLFPLLLCGEGGITVAT